MFTLESQVVQMREELAETLSSDVEDSRDDLGTNIPFKFEIVVTSLITRFLDLFDASVLLAENERYVPAIVLSRCCIESAAVIFLVHRNTEKYLKDADAKAFGAFLDRTALGTRDGKTSIEATNVLGAIDKLDKQFPKVRSAYDHLSEYAHPNWIGTFGSYFKINKDGPGFSVGSMGEALETDLKPAQSSSLAIALHFQRKLAEASEEVARIATNGTT